MQNQNTKVHSVLSLIIYGVLCIFVLAKGVIHAVDSSGFLAMDFHRSIGYNAFLKVFTTVFGQSFGYPLIIVQLALLIGSSYYLLKTIKAIFNPHYAWLLALQLILIAPAFYLHFVANAILSEGLAYPLFLVVTALILKGFILKSTRHYYYALLVLCALLLTRGQFVAMIPVMLIVIAFDAYKSKFNKEKMLLIGAVLLLPFISGFAGKIYNKAVYGLFESTPFNNVSLITAAFYVADAEDYKLFKTKEEQLFFQEVYSQLDSLGLSKAKVEASDSHSYSLFHSQYHMVCNLSIHETGTLHYEKLGLDKNQQLIAVNNLTGNMLMPLLKDNFAAWFKLYVLNVKNAFGSAKQLLLYMLILLASVVFMVKRNDRLSKFIFAVTLIMFANSTIIPLAVHSIKRYLFYTDWVIFAIVILLLNEIFTKQQRIND